MEPEDGSAALNTTLGADQNPAVPGKPCQCVKHDDQSPTLEPDSPLCGDAGAGTHQYGSMILACKVYPASPTSLRNACVLISPVTHTASNSSFIG